MAPKKCMIKKFLFLLLSVIIVNIAFSQSINDTIVVDDIVVTGTKIETTRQLVPLSVGVISRENIEKTGETNILTVLNKYVPGIFVTQRNILGFGVSTGSSGSISIRGVGGSPNTGVLVLIDGHPQHQGIFGHPLPDAYLSTDVEKVEVLRGPASILYGSNAMGGVVNIITKKNAYEGFVANFGASYGSYNTQKYNGSVSFRKNKINILASVNHNKTDGIRQNTDFKITNAYIKANYNISQHFNITADYSIAKFFANDNGPITNPPVPFSIDIMRAKTSLSFENKFDKFEGALKLFYNYGVHNLSDGWYSKDRNTGLMFYQTLKILPNNTITFGTDFKQIGGIGNKGVAQNQFKTVNEAAIYSYLQQTFFSKLTLSAGLRFENSSEFGNELIPLGAISFRLFNNTTLKALISKGFRSPTIMELYLFAPNEQLEPERLINYEVGILQTFWKNRLSFELSLYQLKANNLIQVVGVFPNAKRQNVGSFTNKGIEISSRYNIVKGLNVYANYSYIWLEKPLIAVPQQQFNFVVQYSYKFFSFNFNAQHIQKLYLSTEPQNTLTQSYTLLNLRLAFRPLNFLEFYISINNLLNQTYQINKGYPMPGINFDCGIKIWLNK